MRQPNDADNIELTPVAMPVQLRILLADDSRVIQAQVAHILRSLGHEVTVVTNGLAAVEITGKRQFDLVLMDLEMPVMGGLEATLAIRERERGAALRTRIIGLSAHSSDAFAQHCLVLGLDGYITKPMNAEHLQSLCSGS